MLLTQKVFQEIWVGFVLAGHTHEDKVEWFYYLSKQLKPKYMLVLAKLMKKLMLSQFLSYIPNLIQEVADFKIFMKCYVEELVRLKKFHIFTFYMNNCEWLYSKYENLNLIHSGCRKTIWFPCGRKMVVVVHLSPEVKHPLSKLDLLRIMFLLDVTETKK